MSRISLTVNGRNHTVDVEPSTPLLYVLRNDLDLRGPRFGCGLGETEGERAGDRDGKQEQEQEGDPACGEQEAVGAPQGRSSPTQHASDGLARQEGAGYEEKEKIMSRAASGEDDAADRGREQQGRRKQRTQDG